MTKRKHFKAQGQIWNMG